LPARVVGEYTVSSIVAVTAVLAGERWWWRTGLLRRRTFWLTIAIVAFFQALVDGWLTKLSAPIVLYRRSATSGLRFPWDMPVEDFLFGFALVTLVLVRWEARRACERRP